MLNNKEHCLIAHSNSILLLFLHGVKHYNKWHPYVVLQKILCAVGALCMFSYF